MKPVLPWTAEGVEEFLNIEPITFVKIDREIIDHKINPYQRIAERLDREAVEKTGKLLTTAVSLCYSYSRTSLLQEKSNKDLAIYKRRRKSRKFFFVSAFYCCSSVSIQDVHLIRFQHFL